MSLDEVWLAENDDKNQSNQNISRIDEDDLDVDFFEGEEGNA